MSREGGVQFFSVENIAGTAPRAGTASEGIMVVSDEEVAALIAEFKRVQRERETALIAELERVRRETEAMRAKLEKAKRKLDESKSEREIQKRAELEWPQPETVDTPMSPLLQGPEQSAPTTVALAAEVPAADVTTDTRVFPDTAAPDVSVQRAATKLTSAAGPSSKISGEGRASTGTLVPLAVCYNNNNKQQQQQRHHHNLCCSTTATLLSWERMPAGYKERESGHRFGSPL